MVMRPSEKILDSNPITLFKLWLRHVRIKSGYSSEAINFLFCKKTINSSNNAFDLELLQIELLFISRRSS